MRPGYFFELMPDSDLRKEQTIFRYRRLSVHGDFPIYLVLGAEKLELCISIPGKYGNTMVFELIYSDYESAKGKLSRQILEVPNWQPFIMDGLESYIVDSFQIEEGKSQKFLCYSSVFEFGLQPATGNGTIANILVYPIIEELGLEPHELKEIQSIKNVQVAVKHKSEGATRNPETDGVDQLTFKPGDTKDNFKIKLDPQIIFLDLLFDLKHSDEFHYSKYFNTLIKIARENPVLRSIFSLLEAKYWRYACNGNNKDAQNGISQVLERWVLTNRNFSNYSWIESIIDKEVSHLLLNAGWIEFPLEETLFIELEDRVANIQPKQNQKERKKRKEEELWAKVTEWCTKRYMYRRIAVRVATLNPIHTFILLIPILWIAFIFALDISGVENWQLFRTNYSSPIDYHFRRIGFCLSIVSLFSLLWFSIMTQTCNQRNTILHGALIRLISLRIIISSVLAWGAVALTKPKGIVENVSALSTSFWILFILILGLAAIYLGRELSSVANDLPFRKLFARTIISVLLIVMIIFFIGISTLSCTDFLFPLTVNQQEAPASLIGKVLKTTPFVFFTTIFLNFLFAGKRFTGM